MEYDDIRVETNDGITLITLNKPEKLNPITFKTLYELIKAFEAVEADDDVRVMVITGAGRGFCSGADLSLPEAAATYAKLIGERFVQEFPGGLLGLMIDRLGHMRKPTIAAVNGVAVGAGFGICLACDMRIASTQARFSNIFTKRAMVSHAGVPYYLPRIVGVARAMEMILTDRMVSAEEADKIGLVNRVVQPEELMPAAMELAQTIAKGPTITIELNKRIIYDGLNRDLTSQLQNEQYGQSIARNTEDAKEGMQSFLERREPVFKGR
jgi:2-(1,2-epoxy-1,2-dihydrophenyl)acetyl-CoA isomerase